MGGRLGWRRGRRRESLEQVGIFFPPSIRPSNFVQWSPRVLGITARERSCGHAREGWEGEERSKNFKLRCNFFYSLANLHISACPSPIPQH